MKHNVSVRVPRRPLIGLSANRFPKDPQRAVYKNKELYYTERLMVESINRAKGLAVLVPGVEADASEYAASIDALILSPGSDVCPRSYGRAEFDPQWPGEPERDAYEIALIHACIAAERPVLGICRGMQILNVALGGTLYQDITTERSGSLVHRSWEQYEQNAHPITIAPGSWMERLYGDSITVNSIHHQGVRNLATTLVATAHAPDGVIEAFESRDNRWIRAVQWHPEFSSLATHAVKPSEILFESFVAEVERAREHRTVGR